MERTAMNGKKSYADKKSFEVIGKNTKHKKRRVQDLKKRIIPAILAFGVMMTASAADYKIADGTTNVTVTEQTTAEKDATLIVVKSGKSINDNDDIYALETTKADENGKAVWSFDMQEKRNGVLTDGEYDLYIKVSGQNFKTDKMIYSSLESRNSLLSSLQGVTSKDNIGTIVDDQSLEITLKGAGFDVESYNKLTANNSDLKDEILTNAFSEGGSFANTTVSQSAEAFNKAVATAGIRTDGANADKYLTSADFEFEGTKYTKITDSDKKTWIADQIGGAQVTTVSETQKAYDVANMLYIINNTRVSGIYGVISKYASALGISDSTEYKAYTALYSTDAADEYIVNSLSAAPAKSVSALLAVIGEGATQTSGSSGTTESGRPAGGGGGGSSSSGGYVSGTGLGARPVLGGAETVVSLTFGDLKGFEWAAEAIDAMVKKNVVAGDGKGSFNPDNSVTREEFVKMLVGAADLLKDGAKCGFKDANEGDWFYKYVASAFESGVVTGISEDSFGVGEKLTREDMAVLCKRAKQGALLQTREAQCFSDDGEISDYAKDIVYELYAAGMINGMGDGSFAPKETATRAQAAVMIYNMFIK